MKSRSLVIVITVVIVALGVATAWMLFLKHSDYASDLVPAKATLEQPSADSSGAASDDAASTSSADTPAPVGDSPATDDGTAGADDGPPAADSPAEDTPTPANPEDGGTVTPLPDLTGSKGAQHLGEAILQALKEPDGTRSTQAFIAQMQEQGLLTPEQAAALTAWAQENKATSIESVGTFEQDGKKVTRYRIKGDKGSDLLMDLEAPADAAGAWAVAQIFATAQDEEGQALVDKQDSLQVAEGFINAVKAGDMLLARSFVTGKQVSDVTVAGLCMVFAEGGYQLRDQRPIRSSFQNELAAAYLIYLQAVEAKAQANVGVEMVKGEDGAWLVSAVALDSLLSSYEKTADEEGGRYFPLVKNPQGGDSLALFFAFDDSQLTPRSLRQLSIVADLLKQNDRKLDISGHTDDVGGEGYNEKLSLRRAEAVKAALISFGVRADQISTVGMGMRQPRRSYAKSTQSIPLDDEDKMDALRAENRRAEIYLDFK